MREIIYKRWVKLPLSSQGIELHEMTKVLEDQQLTCEVWLVGNETSSTARGERITTAIAFVVDNPGKAIDDHEFISLIERLDVIASKIGLGLMSWAFVSSRTAREEIASLGVRVFP